LVLCGPSKGQCAGAFSSGEGREGWHFISIFTAPPALGVVDTFAVTTSGIYLTFPQTIGPFVRAHLPGGETTNRAQPGYVPAQGLIGPEEAIALAAFGSAQRARHGAGTADD